jgi:hypothetical protein
MDVGLIWKLFVILEFEAHSQLCTDKQMLTLLFMYYEELLTNYSD